MLPYLNSGRHVVMDTCHLGIVFVGVLVLVDILGTVLWTYLKRCVWRSYVYVDAVAINTVANDATNETFRPTPTGFQHAAGVPDHDSWYGGHGRFM